MLETFIHQLELSALVIALILFAYSVHYLIIKLKNRNKKKVIKGDLQVDGTIFVEGNLYVKGEIIGVLTDDEFKKLKEDGNK